jgi:hypothetical protein
MLRWFLSQKPCRSIDLSRNPSKPSHFVVSRSGTVHIAFVSFLRSLLFCPYSIPSLSLLQPLLAIFFDFLSSPLLALWITNIALTPNIYYSLPCNA